MKKLMACMLVALTGCVNVNTQPEPVATEVAPEPPQLWSDHLWLEIPVQACAKQGLRSLQSLGYNQTVRNGNYSYGNFAANRAAVKCVENGTGSLVYLMVAGPDRKTVEKLRNELVRQFRQAER